MVDDVDQNAHVKAWKNRTNAERLQGAISNAPETVRQKANEIRETARAEVAEARSNPGEYNKKLAGKTESTLNAIAEGKFGSQYTSTFAGGVRSTTEKIRVERGGQGGLYPIPRKASGKQNLKPAPVRRVPQAPARAPIRRSTSGFGGSALDFGSSTLHRESSPQFSTGLFGADLPGTRGTSMFGFSARSDIEETKGTEISPYRRGVFGSSFKLFR